MRTEALTATLAALPLPTLVIDRHERLVAVNAEARTLLGTCLIGRPYTMTLRQPEVLEAVEASLRDEVPRSARYLAHDGAQDTVHDMTCRYVPGLGEDGTGAVIVSLQDVTTVEQAGQIRRDFVANVSHELRTPLTALIGFIETLRGPAREDAAARDRFLSIMQTEAARMNRLIADLLSLSHVESEGRVRPTEIVNLGACVSETLGSLRPLAEAAGVELNLLSPAQEISVTGDSDQLRQVFTNLIENAIKYGGAGGRVDVAIDAVDWNAALRAPAVRVRVTDYGPGIDPQHLPRLTERFYRGDTHRSRELGGTGLGLAIVKHIVNRHRGRLRVSSTPGQGAVFTVLLPGG